MNTNDKVKTILDQLRNSLLHPERRSYSKNLPDWRPKKPPLKPRERLAVRLAMLNALKEWELALIKETMADTESIEDHKRAS